MYINVSQRIQQESIRTHIMNCSNMTPCGCVNDVNSSTGSMPPGEQVMEIEAFFYIVVVIVFYATSIVFLLVKYAQNDDEEKHLKYQYSEFVKRERFQAPMYKNKLALERTKALLHSLEENGGLVFNCPVITISNYADNGETDLCTVSGLLTDALLDGNIRTIEGVKKDICGEYGLESAIGTGNMTRSQSLCTLSYDTDLGFACLVNGKENDCVDNSKLSNKKGYKYEKSHSI